MGGGLAMNYLTKLLLLLFIVPSLLAQGVSSSSDPGPVDATIGHGGAAIPDCLGCELNGG